MKLRWYIHGQHCLTVETGGGRALPEIEWRGETLRRVCAGWNRTPERRIMEHWLEGAMPESGAAVTFRQRAHDELARRGIDVGQGTIHDIAWANADWEYPGAIHFERAEDGGKRKEQDGYLTLSEADTGDRLREAADEADVARRLRRHSGPKSKSALSGAQGKSAVHFAEPGQVALPQGRALSTWILKVENRPDMWPGEAGVESVCQRALTYLDIEAANTYARIMDGIPVIMSERTDRRIEDGRVVARHQEDWLQAFGRSSGWKYQRDDGDSGFASLYAIVRRYAVDPERETRQVTRLLAAACSMTNGDLHRKNIGLLHASPNDPFSVKLAPAYDFSSQCGVDGAGDELKIDIVGMRRAWDVDEARWRALADRCRLNPEHVLDTVRETARDAPVALAAARDECRERDEYRDPDIVDKRIEATIAAARRYARTMGGRRTKKTTKPVQRARRDDQDQQR